MDEARYSTEEILATIDPETGEPPESVLKDARSLREIWSLLEQADEEGAFNRSCIRSLVNGQPPYNQSQRAEEGTDGLFNVNTGNGRLLVDMAASAFMDIFTSEGTLTEIPLDPLVEDASRAQKIIEDEFTRMLRHGWGAEFYTRAHDLCQTFAADGVAFAMFENDDTWKVSTAALKDLKVPRYCEPVSTMIPLAVLRKNIHVGTLYRHIRDEEAARARGWNVEGVRDAILHSCSRRRHDQWRDWETLEQDLKSNELYVSSVAEPIEVLHGIVEEYDGTVSLVMGTAHRDSKVSEFLFRRPQRYGSANEVWQVFPYSSGHGNMLYSIRGIGYFIYQLCNAENVLFNSFMDAAKTGSKPMFQPSGTEDFEDIVLQDMGAATLLPPGVNLVQQNQQQDLTKTLGPAMGVATDLLQRVSGGLNEGVAPMGERANEATISLALEQINKGTSFALTLFYPPLDRIYREMIRRIFVLDLDTSESRAMKARLEKQGVTKELWSRIDIDMVHARRILSGPNKTGRALLLRQVRGALIGEMDDQGRKESAFDICAATLGHSYAVRYIGEPEKTRTTFHDWIAELEVSQMLDGHRFEALDGQDHLVHLRVKLSALLATKDGVENGTLDLKEYTLRNLPIWENANQHMAMLVVDPSLEQEAGKLSQQLQQLGELFGNGLRAIEKDVRDGKGKAQQNGGGQPPVDTELEAFLKEEQRKDLANQAEIERKNAESAAKIARQAAEQDVMAAAKLREKRLE